MAAQMSTLATTGGNRFSGPIKKALGQAIAEEGKLDAEVLAIEGMSGRKYRLFINNLVAATHDARYLEIGTWQGSTLCSAIFGNKVCALAIDNWTEFDGPSDRFFHNLARFKPPSAKVSFLEADFREVDFSALGKFNIYLFDGPHDPIDQRNGLLRALPALDDQFVYVVDDWNWDYVRRGALEGIREAGLSLDHVVEIRTSTDNTQPEWRGKDSDWHNGYFIAACSKREG